jgi:hypothetical protein
METQSTCDDRFFPLLGKIFPPAWYVGFPWKKKGGGKKFIMTHQIGTPCRQL